MSVPDETFIVVKAAYFNLNLDQKKAVIQFLANKLNEDLINHEQRDKADKQEAKNFANDLFEKLKRGELNE